MHNRDLAGTRYSPLNQINANNVATLVKAWSFKLQPENADALNQRCGARAAVGALKEALEDCNAALNLKPNNATALDHRGMAYLKLGQPDQALADYDEALKARPNSPAALYGRGVAKLMKGDVAASNADFEIAKQIKPSIAEEFTKVGVGTKPKSWF